jgi:hypothetical protein
LAAQLTADRLRGILGHDRIFAHDGKLIQDVSGYGQLSMPPSEEARAIVSSFPEEDRVKFTNLLGQLQTLAESFFKIAGVPLHPETRADLWGAALREIGDEYLKSGRSDKTLFFTEAAWKVSEYPLFAYNAGILRSAMEDVFNAKPLLETYLSEYRFIQPSSSPMSVDPEVTVDELKDAARTALAELIAFKITTTFSLTRFTELFRDETLSEGWTLDDALAVWYSVGHVAMVIAALDETSKIPDDISPIIQLCKRKMLKHWGMPDTIFKKLRSVVDDLENAAVNSFISCSEADDLERFASQYTSRIKGSRVPFSHSKTWMRDCLQAGLIPNPCDPAKTFAIWRMFFSVQETIMKLLKQHVPI